MEMAKEIWSFLNMGAVGVLVTVLLFVYEFVRSKRDKIRAQRSDIKDAIRSEGIDRLLRTLLHEKKRACSGERLSGADVLLKDSVEELLDFCNAWCEKLEGGLICEESFSDLAEIIRSILANNDVQSYLFDLCAKRNDDVNMPWEALLRFGSKCNHRLFSGFCKECLSALYAKSAMLEELRPSEASDSDAIYISEFKEYLTDVKHLKVGSVQSVVSMVRSAARKSNLNLNVVLKRDDGVECVIEELVRNVNPTAKTLANYKHAISCYVEMLRKNR